MTTAREYTTMDKSGWGDGAWHAEPDKVQWTDEDTALPCLAVRNRLGAWCGYVGVSEGHPWFGKDYDDCRIADDVWPDVHGGLTYAAFCQEGDEAESICHVPESGQPDCVWWLGFDCAHGGDLVPGMVFREGEPPIRSPHESYRDLHYVKGEVASLAAQASTVAPKAEEGEG